MRFVALSTLLLLAGCSAANYAMSTYDGINPVDFRDPATGESWRVFDKPGENRMMITKGLGAATASALFGAFGNSPAILYEQAAIRWLSQYGRQCRVLRSFLVVEPQYEVQYDCTPIPPTPQ